MTELENRLYREITRRTLLKAAGASALSLSAAALLDACDIRGTSNANTGKITIGYVSPQTGEAAGFATGDNYVINGIRGASAYKSGFKAGGKGYDVEIIVKDSQSNPTRAAAVTQELINSGADIVLCASTPEVTNPVATLCEASGVPCVATIVPWEAWYFGRGAKPGDAFKFTTMFFFGLHEFAGCFFPMWAKMNTNKVVAEMYPNDPDGAAFRTNFIPLVKAAGYTSIDGGAYADGTTDYSSMINTFKNKNAQLYSNVPLPPDFNTFWKQAAQQGFKPKLATVAKVLLFPADTTALGDLVINIATDCWWSPYHPYTSTLTGQTAKQLADGFEQSTGQQWLSSLGSVHSLFEIAHEALTNVDNPHDKTAVAGKLKTLSYTGISGPLDWTKGPMPGIAIQQPVGVQWRKGSKYPYSMVVVDNSLNKDVPTNGDLQPTNA
ncbi:MAG: ABC transporter substrate-binding protein [Chloroflexi bacterium]|nr:MAG: ABC transporter substrate-binding protein [Chloroflexota bacterium]TMC71400.1 MAG: ABC transporter substrate-binding protein [Chloroflexota bacterium]